MILKHSIYCKCGRAMQGGGQAEEAKDKVKQRLNAPCSEEECHSLRSFEVAWRRWLDMK
jgi:hypothetical protein